jgi:cytochrome oxidase assembly protein ShyY1
MMLGTRILRRLSTVVNPPASRSGILLFSGLTALTSGLGIWQIQRFFWKRDLLAARTSSMAAPAVDLSHGKRPIEANAYVRAFISSATPDTTRSVLLEPRVAPSNLPASLAARQIVNAGRCLIVPLRRTDGTYILALIGWLPSDANVEAALAAFVTSTLEKKKQNQSLIGVVRESEDPGVWKAEHGRGGSGGGGGAAAQQSSSSSSSSSLPSFTFIDVPAIAAACSFSAERGDECSIIVELIEPSPLADVRIPWPVTRSENVFTETTTPPTTHAIYAGTWLTLAAYGLVATLNRVRGGRGRGGERRLVMK